MVYHVSGDVNLISSIPTLRFDHQHVVFIFFNGVHDHCNLGTDLLYVETLLHKGASASSHYHCRVIYELFLLSSIVLDEISYLELLATIIQGSCILNVFSHRLKKVRQTF